jgi:hypothetical protein
VTQMGTLSWDGNVGSPIGFALPLGPVMGLARTVLVLLGWSSLSRRRART